MTNLIDDLWDQVEANGELSAPLVDAVMEVDEVLGAMLLWCYENGKWPGATLGLKPMWAGYWFIHGHNITPCYCIPWMSATYYHIMDSKDTARKAYEALSGYWVKHLELQKLRDEMRSIYDKDGYTIMEGRNDQVLNGKLPLSSGGGTRNGSVHAVPQHCEEGGR